MTFTLVVQTGDPKKRNPGKTGKDQTVKNAAEQSSKRNLKTREHILKFPCVIDGIRCLAGEYIFKQSEI